MMEQFEKLLKRQGGLYTFGDVMECIDRGTMQSFAEGDTWVITQVHQFPRKKVVEIAYVIGDTDHLKKIEQQIIQWAEEIGASMLIATGRPGWDRKHFPGWTRVSSNFTREI